eukprot:TRINITY_DN62953_c0_g1_i1.p1 TRINITY_DN62953_c0_g1~~TRINITY_DN62953_c0_g1_i1.p1  ORF type:complete len:145 (+),score=29.13 TRINITY_DN62953_c0_g1_i1:68-502(+)
MLGSILVYGIALPGLVLFFLVLSGFWILEEVVSKVTHVGFHIGPVKMNVAFLCFTVSAVTLAYETHKLQYFSMEGKDEKMASMVQMSGDYRQNKWRHERNFWIAAFSTVLWFANMRVGYLLNRLRSIGEKSKSEDKSANEKKSK